MGALPVALAIAAAAQAGAEPYRAAGSEPSAWSLTIADGRMTFERPGRPAVSVAAPRPRVEEDIRTYRAGRLSATMIPYRCTDRASGRRYPDSVEVTEGGRSFAGCGGAAHAADSLVDTSWHIAEIAGEATGLTGDLLRDDRYAIDFHAEAMVGYGGCNRFSAGYVREGDRFATRPPYGLGGRACAEPIMNRQRRLFEILGQPMRISFPDGETMVLTGEAGTVRLRRIRSED